MFSQLGPLFRTTLRQAQAADTRLEIRRDHQQDQGKGKQFGAGEEEGSSLWEDSTSVSIGALRAFLLEFLTSRNIALPHDDAALPSYVPPALEPGNPIAARAVKAYAQTTGHTAMPAPQPAAPAPENEADLSTLLQAEELRTMHRLIGQLDALAAAGVQTLTIDKADTFLEALVSAVAKAKSAL